MPSRDGELVFDDQDGGGHGAAILHRAARRGRRGGSCGSLPLTTRGPESPRAAAPPRETRGCARAARHDSEVLRSHARPTQARGRRAAP